MVNNKMCPVLQVFRQIFIAMSIFGIDILKLYRSFKGLGPFLKDYFEFRKQLKKSLTPFCITKLYPCLEDRFALGGTASGQYFHQDLLVASKIFQNNPMRHVDVGSRIDGFVAHVASFREIEIIDISDLDIHVPTKKLPNYFREVNL